MASGRARWTRLSVLWEGSWQMDGERILLRLEGALNQPAIEPFEIRLTPSDGALLLSDVHTPPGENLRLRRVAGRPGTG